MLPGKAAAQAGHAFLGTVLASQSRRPHLAAAYLSLNPGTKVCLVAPDEEAILRAHFQCHERGIPSYVVIDSGCKNFHDGQPIITALGVGPTWKQEINKILGRFKLL